MFLEWEKEDRLVWQSVQGQRVPIAWRASNLLGSVGATCCVPWEISHGERITCMLSSCLPTVASHFSSVSAASFCFLFFHCLIIVELDGSLLMELIIPHSSSLPLFPTLNLRRVVSEIHCSLCFVQWWSCPLLCLTMCYPGSLLPWPNSPCLLTWCYLQTWRLSGHWNKRLLGARWVVHFFFSYYLTDSSSSCG